MNDHAKRFLGTVAGALPFVATTFAIGSPLPTAYFAFPLLVAALALLHDAKGWFDGGPAVQGASMGPAIGLLVAAIVETRHHVSSHNLLGIEIIFGVVYGYVAAAAGAFIASLLRRVLPGPAAAAGKSLMVVLAVLLGAQTLYTVLDMARVRADLEAKLALLVDAQEAYRRQFPERGYTCNLAELGVTGVAAVDHERRFDGSVYHAATTVRHGDYVVELLCQAGDAAPHEWYLVLALEDGWRPMPVYCADPRGQVRHIAWMGMYSCPAHGEVVERARAAP